MRQRSHGHKYLLRKNTHPNPILQCAWNKYGESVLRFEVLKLCNVDSLLSQEQEFIERLNCITPNGYNVRKEAASNRGWHHSEETKKKLKGVNKGRKHSPEIRARMAEAQKGKKRSLQTRLKISLACQLRGRSNKQKEWFKKMMANKMGCKLTITHRRHISEALRGKLQSSEHTEKVRLALTGRKQSKERRALQSRLLKGKPWSAKRRAALKLEDRQEAGRRSYQTRMRAR